MLRSRRMGASTVCRHVRTWNGSSFSMTPTRLIGDRRGDHNRLGFVLQATTVRYLGVLLEGRAWTHAEGPYRLFAQAVAWLRRNRVLLPGASVLARPTISLDGRYRTTSRPPATGLRPLRTD